MRTIDNRIFDLNMCECHKVNWMSILNTGKYEMMDGSPIKEGVSCDDKVNNDEMTFEEYNKTCKYIPAVLTEEGWVHSGSKFPKEVFEYLQSPW